MALCTPKVSLGACANQLTVGKTQKFNDRGMYSLLELFCFARSRRVSSYLGSYVDVLGELLHRQFGDRV